MQEQNEGLHGEGYIVSLETTLAEYTKWLANKLHSDDVITLGMKDILSGAKESLAAEYLIGDS